MGPADTRDEKKDGRHQPGHFVGPTTPFAAFPRDAVEQSIPARFDQQVRQYPHRLAVKTGPHALTYEALHREAQRVAHAILAEPGHGNEPIALLFEPGAPLIAAILGILQAGKIYVPLDPTFPWARTMAMLADSQAPLIVTNTGHLAAATALAQHGEHVLNIDEMAAGPAAEPRGIALSPDTLACILYTSGSTGHPKGVVHSHRSVLHAVANYTNLVHISADDHLSLVQSCSVLGGMRDTFNALLNGATLCPFDVEAHGLRQLADWLRQEEITICNAVPTLFRQLGSMLTSEDRFPNLRLLKLGGESVTRQDVERFQHHCPPDSFLYLHLATTETGGSVRAFFVDHATQLTGSVVPVGYAVDDMEVFLLDGEGRAVGSDGIGEIAVKSRYLAGGYWRQPDLTRTVFLPDPAGSDARIYRTGDLGRLRPDGCLEHLGRKDLQVKVRGYRVEPAEIELALLDHGAIKEAAVVGRQEPADDARLVAYIVPSRRPAPPVSALQGFLREKLPDYMVPATFVVLDALPLTPNGKVDRQALPAPEGVRPALAQPFVTPRTPIEEELARLWAAVLDLEQIGVYDHFHDLGGHSLVAMQIAVRVHDAWHVDIPLSAFLEAPTVADMALVIAQDIASRTEVMEFGRLLTEVEALSEDATQSQGRDMMPKRMD